MKIDYQEPSKDVLSKREKVRATFMELAQNMQDTGSAAILMRFIGVYEKMDHVGEVGSGGKTGDAVLLDLCKSLGMVVPNDEEIIDATPTES